MTICKLNAQNGNHKTNLTKTKFTKCNIHKTKFMKLNSQNENHKTKLTHSQNNIHKMKFQN